MRQLHRVVPLLVLALVLSACQFRFEHAVDVAADGSGTVECLALFDPGEDEEADDLIDGRFAELPDVPAGWAQEPVDDGTYEGTRSSAAFSDPDDLVALLATLSAANEEAGVGEPCFGLTTEGPDPLLAVDAAEARWSQALELETTDEGEIELGDDVGEAVLEAADLEISVRLPGALDTHNGDAVGADDSTVTWRPDLAQSVDLHARSVLREVTNRVAGADRYATAAAVSARFFTPGVDVVFVANGLGFADALAASGAAGSEQAPVLLTAPGALPDATRAELERLAPDRVVILGGSAAVGGDVEAELGELAPTVDRVSGADRYETAAKVTGEFFGDASTVYLATGRNFPDALGGGAAAAAGGHPLLLTEPGALPDATRAEVERLGPDRVVILGGSAAVDGSVETTLGDLAPTVDRLSGGNRYETALAVATDAFATADTVLVATGTSAPDALAGAAAAGQTGGPVLLTPPTALPEGLPATVSALAPDAILVLGGRAVVSDNVAILLEDLVP